MKNRVNYNQKECKFRSTIDFYITPKLYSKFLEAPRRDFLYAKSYGIYFSKDFSF